MTYRRAVVLFCDGEFDDGPCRMQFGAALEAIVPDLRDKAASAGWYSVDVDMMTTKDYCPLHIMQGEDPWSSEKAPA